MKSGGSTGDADAAARNGFLNMQEGTQDTRQFAIAVKSSARRRVRPDWQQELTDTPGVRVVGGSGSYAEVEATAEAAEALRDKLGPDFFVEEESPRQPI